MTIPPNKPIPILGFTSLLEFCTYIANQYDISKYTVKYHMSKGFCTYPRQTAGSKSKHPLYSTWSQMKQRCYNTNSPNYHRYGGRGITICNRWINSFDNFVKDMGERPANHSLDRINNDGNYEPSNCRWATAKEQNENKSPAKGGISEHSQGGWQLHYKSKYAGYCTTYEEAELLLNKLRNENFKSVRGNCKCNTKT